MRHVKIDMTLVPQWRSLVSVYNSAFLDVVLNTDGGYLLWYGGYTYFNVVKVSANGDLLWVKSQVSPYVSKLLEINSRYYGLVYQSINISAAEIQVYNYGIDFENEHPVNPLFIIPTYPLLDQCFYGFGEPFCGIKTSDNGVILAISTPTSEIFKFDNNLNLLWCSNALSNERTGVGKHPIIEMQNGDIVYAATVLSQYDMTERLAIVRIDSNGNYVGIVDEFESSPPVTCVSAYPNPFTTEITLSIKGGVLPTSKFIIYNIKGQQVESIYLNDPSVTWVPKDIPSGLYIVKLVEGSKTIESHLISYIK